MKKTTNSGIGEFKSLFDLLQAFPDETSCIKYLEKKLWPDGEPISPYDPTSKVYRRGDGMYRCKNTGKNFNIRIGTIFEGSKVELRKWFIAIFEITTSSKGISSVKLANDIGVTQKTAWYMNHRIREAFNMALEEKLDGEVELDETFVGGKNKRKHLCRYVNEFVFRYNTKKISSVERFNLLLCNINYRTTYQDLIK